jgi:ubiquinone/menaquinone biosynthesis C-methylase UbiE
MNVLVNYNYIASFYDRLCQLVFGQSVKNAQIASLGFIPPTSNVLIVGAGTGWILEEINKIHQNGLSITYIDISST